MEDVQVLKQKLLEKISGIEDYEILQLLSEDVEVYETSQKTEGPYDFPGATEEERAELIRIDQGGEIPDDELLTQEEFDEEMKKMAYQIDFTKRYLNNLKKLTAYLEQEWGYSVAVKFTNEVDEKLKQLAKHPYIGSLQGREAIRSIILSKHNRLYYRIEGEKITIVNMMDMRIDPANNPYKK